MIKLSFNGALSTVGASAVLIETGTERIVLDYGTKIQEIPPKFPLPIEGKPDAILLSHTHLDHLGGTPIFFTKGNSCPIYAIDVTKPLAELLLLDSIKVGREEGIELPFTKADVRNTIRNFLPVRYRVPFKIHKTKVTCFDAGHIPGSMMIHLNTGEKTLLYTGDFNTKDTRLLEKAEEDLPKVNILITESTYADRNHADRKSQEKQLVETINNTLAVDGVCLVAGFAVGRIDEILLLLDAYGIDYPLYIDGMAKKAITIINKHRNLLRKPDSLDKALKNVEYIYGERMRRRIIRQPCVILSTSGMLSGGPIVQYMKKLHDEKDCSLVLTSYQCIAGGTSISLNNEEKEIKDIFKESKRFQEWDKFKIRKLNENLINLNTNRRNLEINDAVLVARREHEGTVIRITTTNGGELILSPEHPVLTKGMIWKKAEELNANDEIVVLEK